MPEYGYKYSDKCSYHWLISAMNLQVSKFKAWPRCEERTRPADRGQTDSLSPKP